jgi:hypothetical protein
MYSMFVTELVSHPEMFALNADALLNIYRMSVTELVSHPEMSALNTDAPQNAEFKLVSALTSHPDASGHGSAHATTASLSASRLLNVSASDPETNKTTSRSIRATITGIDVVIKGGTRFVRLFDLENLADPELSQRRYVVLEGDKSWCCVQHYHQL